MKQSVLSKLQGGDLRSIGRSEEVVQETLQNPELFKELFEGMSSKDAVLRARCADAIEKASRRNPQYLQPLKSRLINELAPTATQQEVRWHLAQMFSRIDLDASEEKKVAELLFSWINDEKNNSKIVKTFALQALADIAKHNKDIRPKVIKKLRSALKDGSPAMKSRGRKILEEFSANQREAGHGKKPVPEKGKRASPEKSY